MRARSLISIAATCTDCIRGLSIESATASSITPRMIAAYMPGLSKSISTCSSKNSIRPMRSG